MSTTCLSIIIVGNDKAVFLKDCIESCSAVTQQVIYVDLNSKDNSLEAATACGIVAREKPSSGWPEELLSIHTEWLLFLRPDEVLVTSSVNGIEELLRSSTSMGYCITVNTPMAPQKLDDYRWIKIPGKRNSYDATSLIVPKIEMRLVRSKYLLNALDFMTSCSQDRPFSFTSHIFKGIQIHSCPDIGNLTESKEVNGTRDLEMNFLKGKISLDAEEDYGMWELGERFIGYNILQKNDLYRYYRGLVLGFGSEKMYLAMIHNQMKYGRFADAKDFFEAWSDKWKTFDTAAPYKTGGIIYLHLLQFEKALRLFERCLELSPESDLPEAHQLIAKTLLLYGRKKEAIKHLQEARGYSGEDQGDAVLDMMGDGNWNPPKLSLCMIARDEEKHIAKAIDSVRDIVDEIIVADTGSQDDTKNIARKYNATVVDADWSDDFSEARNLCLARATGNYVLWLDADEYIDPRERIKLALLKMTLPVSRDIAYSVKIEMEDEDEEMSAILRLPKTAQPVYALRLVPVHPDILFKGAAFENIGNSLHSLNIKIITNELFKITHAETDRKARDKRKRPAVQKLFQTSPDPETAMDAALYNLRMGDIDSAIQWLQLAQPGNARIWMKIITLYCRLGRTNNVSEIIRRALRDFPDSLELTMAKAELDFAEGRYEAVYETLGANIQHIEKQLSREDRAAASYLYGMALIELGNLGTAINFLSDARELDSWNIRYKIGGVYALTVAEEWEAAISALSDTLRELNLNISDTINNFVDLAMVFQGVAIHFEKCDEIEAAVLCRKIFLNIAENKVSEQEKLQEMIHRLNMDKMRRGNTDEKRGIFT